uniref:Dolichyl-diphosphooligosaccharide--protein glycosyltransferase subunit 1 n=1 Tax=Cacopsylla melanoneura TaxID=428564 RepID=A0A8D8M298_9HEMI
MKPYTSLVFLLSTLIFLSGRVESAVNQDIVFKNVDRVVDISTQITKINYKVVLENTGSKNVDSFEFALEPATSKGVAYFSAVGGELLKSHLATERVKLAGIETAPAWTIVLKEPLKPKSSLPVDVEVALTGILSPFPEQILQKEKQLVQYFGNHYVYSVYKVTSQKTTLQLGTKKVESFSKQNPTSQIDTTIVYGPYKNIAPLTVSKLSVHYENNSPFLVVENLKRVIEVSHWGNIAVEEEIELVHAGAKLKGSFSRYEYQREASSGLASVKSFKTILPAAASDVYYRDEIGNISTSHFRVMADAVEVDLRPRFPLFGGWKTIYILGYNIPSYEYLFNSESQYVLKMRFVDHIFDDMVVKSATVDIILPEHSVVRNIITPYPVLSQGNSVHSTYLDTEGRPVVSFKVGNLVEQHIEDIQIEYEFSFSYMYKEPLLVAAALATVFVVMMACVRMDLSLSKADKTKTN